MDQGPTLMTSFNRNYLPKGSTSKYSPMGASGLNIWIAGDTIQSITGVGASLVDVRR